MLQARNPLSRLNAHNRPPYAPLLAHDEPEYAQCRQACESRHKYPAPHRPDNRINIQRLRRVAIEPPFPHRIISSSFSPQI